MRSDFSFALSKRFFPLFCTQFLGAFNDNFFKTSIFVLVTYHGLGEHTLLPGAQILNIGALLFILPFFLFSAVSGELNTRLNRAHFARFIKALEVAIMLFASYAFFISSTFLLLLCLFLMGTQSTLFGPLKYSILPKYLAKNELMMGNGLIESGTFLAILIGQLIGAMMVAIGPWALAVVIMLVAILGLTSSFYMPSVPAANPSQRIHLNFAYSTKKIMAETLMLPDLKTAIMGISWFWFLGAIYTIQLPIYTTEQLGGNVNVFNLMLTLFSIGIGLGSVLCARISQGKLLLKLIPIGGAGMTIFGLILALSTLSKHQGELISLAYFLTHINNYTVIVSILGLGFFGGFFSVPLYTWLQLASHDDFRANAIAANNIMNSLFMVASALISMLFLFFIQNTGLLFLCLALANIPVLFYLMKMLPKQGD